MSQLYRKDVQYYKFCLYGFLKNLRFFEPFLILFFHEEKGLSFLQIGSIYAVREIAINIMEIPAGVIADSFGRRKSMIVSFMFYILSFFIFFISNTYYVFVIAIIFFAIGDAFRTGTHKAMIFEYLKINGWKDQKVHYYGHTRSWSQMGSAISSILAATIVIFSSNYSNIFLFSIVPYVLDLILIASYPKSLDGVYTKLEFKLIRKRFIEVGKDILISFKNIQILKAVGNLSIHSGFHRSIKDYLQPILQSFAISLPILIGIQDTQRTAILIGIFYFIIYFLTSRTSKLSGKFADKFSSMPVSLNITVIIGFCFALVSGLFYSVEIIPLAIAFYIGIYLIENLRNPIGVAYVSELYNEDILATALSVNSQAKSLLAAIIAIIAGFFADKLGVGQGLMISAGILILISPAYLLKKNDKIS